MTKPVVIDFYADWCGPCTRQGPIIDELKEKMGDSVEIRKLDVDNAQEEAQKYKLTVVPTVIIEKDGKVVERLEGVTSLETLQGILKPLVE